MTTSPKRPLYISKFQTAYLVELLEDDLEVADLDPSERRAAEALLGRAEHLWNDGDVDVD